MVISEIFCIADDFCKVFDAQMAKYTFKAERKRKYHRESRMSKKGLTPHGLLPFPWEMKKPEHTKAASAVSLEDALKHFEEVLGKTKDS